ncbi:hypothetical protein AVEN_180091-1 [Araneus ventricosus]|uniref:Uncharacterized protein n=1 Tax=Araneus ventricosus TaxID=182803 RepID=A0A4Y2RV55_ARAVE|nr:hypothetical protein AVEN_180091-1 [Araneus ventricosus]
MVSWTWSNLGPGGHETTTTGLLQVEKNSISIPRKNPKSDMDDNPRHVIKTTLDFLKNMELGIDCDNLWNKSYNSSEINAPVCKSDHLNQETFTKPTASDEHNGHKFYPSYATRSGEFLPLASPASTHHKNRGDYSKTFDFSLL